MPRKIQILAYLLFIVSVLFRHFFPWHPTSGFPHHNRVETVPAHSSPVWNSSWKSSLSLLGWVEPPQHLLPWGASTQTHMTKSDPPADVVFPIFLSVLSIPYIVNTCGGEEKHILFFYVGKEMRAKRAVSVLLLLLLLLLREGWFGFLFFSTDKF